MARDAADERHELDSGLRCNYLFAGCYIHSVDEKNRISLPAKFRSALEGRLVLTRGPDGCLWVLGMEQWRIIREKAAQSVPIQRFFVASACECVLGAKGRCLLSDSLRQHAGIKPGDEVAIVGLANRIEVWSARRWEAINAQLTSERVREELPEFFQLPS